MAGEHAELIKLAQRLAVLDDDALVAIANRGLLRRAGKDLEKALPEYTGSTGEQLIFEIDGCTIQLGASPGNATCDCGASKVCRHVLATVMYLRDHVASASSKSELEEPIDHTTELMDISMEDLRSWAGKAVFNRGLDATSDDARFEHEATLVMQLPSQNTTVRWLPGQGLEHMLCSCHAVGPCVHKVSAIIAFWRYHDREIPLIPETSLEAASGAPRTRQEVLDSVRQVLSEMVLLGVERVSNATQQRLVTLAVSAHGVELPRLERLLNALASEASLLLKRDAQGAVEVILYNAARIWVLIRALKKPTPALVGIHRSKYQQVIGELDLTGIGARQWRTRSGYEGLTVYFWESNSRRWNTWTDARPVGMQFQASDRFYQEFPWAGVDNPCEASRSRYRVSGIYRNPVGRLSGRPGASAVRVDKSDPQLLPTVKNWKEIIPQLERIHGGGLSDRMEQDEIVFLQPQSIHDPEFDSTTQVLCRCLVDEDNQVLPLLVKHDDAIPSAVEYVESVSSDDLISVLGLLRMGSQGIYVEPITVVTRNGFCHITLDDISSSGSLHSQVAASIDSDTDEDLGNDQENITPPVSEVGILIRQAIENCEEIAESGLRITHNSKPLRQVAANMDALGLDTCHRAVVSVADELDRRSRKNETAVDGAAILLEAAYVLHLALGQEKLALCNRQLV